MLFWIKRMAPWFLVLLLLLLTIFIMMQPQPASACGVQTNPYPCGN